MKKKLITFLLDETGSMETIKQRTIDSFNEYLDTVRNQGKAVRMTLTKFNSARITSPYMNQPIKDIPYLDDGNYCPSSLTPLYDAIAKTIRDTESILAKTQDNPDILVVILTDGLENHSQETTREAVFNLISQKEKDGWAFLYLGANQDAWDVGATLGISGGQTLTYNADNTGITYAIGGAAFATSVFLSPEYTPSSWGTQLSSIKEDSDYVKSFSIAVDKRTKNRANKRITDRKEVYT